MYFGYLKADTLLKEAKVSTIIKLMVSPISPRKQKLGVMIVGNFTQRFQFAFKGGFIYNSYRSA